jgi:hypothetical protein
VDISYSSDGRRDCLRCTVYGFDRSSGRYNGGGVFHVSSGLTLHIANYLCLREYDTVARADNYFAEYRMLFLRRRGNERDIFEIALDGTSLFRGSCIDVIKKRLRKKLKAPTSSRIMSFLKEGEMQLL